MASPFLNVAMGFSEDAHVIKPRLPDAFVESSTKRNAKKWNPILAAFFENDLERLFSIQRTGTLGRIFEVLVAKMLSLLDIHYSVEPIFNHMDPNPLYTELASLHEDIVLRTHDFYNPDFFLEDRIWLECTLSENEAYKKLFRYGHQAPSLVVLWLYEDTGLHQSVYEDVVFPNARVLSVEQFYEELQKVPGGDDIVDHFLLLKSLKGKAV